MAIQDIRESIASHDYIRLETICNLLNSLIELGVDVQMTTMYHNDYIVSRMPVEHIEVSPLEVFGLKYVQINTANNRQLCANEVTFSVSLH